MGNVVKERREAIGLTIGQLARRADITDLTLRNIERGRGNPTIGTLGKIAEVLNCDTRDLIPAKEK